MGNTVITKSKPDGVRVAVGETNKALRGRVMKRAARPPHFPPPGHDTGVKDAAEHYWHPGAGFVVADPDVAGKKKLFFCEDGALVRPPGGGGGGGSDGT